ncbi:hypothetical protein F5051DRAFT_434098 [Lentinula edodes]|nr:hypothetical protein F5051DRAFT_434098 [Lentinula edodes]
MSASSNTFIPDQLSFRSERVLHEQHAIQLELAQHVEHLWSLDVLLSDCYQHHRTREAHQPLSSSELLDATRTSVKSCLGKIQELNTKAIVLTQIRLLTLILKLRNECSRNVLDDPLMDEIINGAVTHMLGFVEKVDGKLEYLSTKMEIFDNSLSMSADLSSCLKRKDAEKRSEISEETFRDIRRN